MAVSVTPLSQIKPHYDVIIIGAGINGSGTFRDLCLQGVNCLVIDRGDICEGASAAPSRLIHGGIKYLETGEFRLVHESAIERNRLLRNAPHYVKPLETVVPVRSWFGGIVTSALRFFRIKGKLKDRGAIITELGLRIYDYYSRKVQALPDHRFFGPARLQQEYPAFDNTIKAAGFYYEGRITHAERLGLELVMDGIAANPESTVCTYATARHDGTSRKIILTDGLTSETTSTSAPVVINAGGAWIDKVNAALGIGTRYMGGSKGSHLIVDNAALIAALKGRMIYFGTADGRVNLVYPFFGNVLIGSTDIPVKDPDEALCSAEEAGYLTKIISEIFPGIAITSDQIKLTYCGVRPLPRSEGVEIGTVSRDHAIKRNELPGTDVPVLSLVGGKWTTFRAFSEQVTDSVLAHLGKSRKLSTQDLAIGGGRNYPQSEAGAVDFVAELAKATGLSTHRAKTLFERYGTAAAMFVSTLDKATDTPLASLPSYSSSEINHICRTENVRRLSDVLLRRTAIAMEGLLTLAVVEEIASIAAKALDWSPTRKATEIEQALADMQRRSVPSSSPIKSAA